MKQVNGSQSKLQPRIHICTEEDFKALECNEKVIQKLITPKSMIFKVPLKHSENCLAKKICKFVHDLSDMFEIEKPLDSRINFSIATVVLDKDKNILLVRKVRDLNTSAGWGIPGKGPCNISNIKYAAISNLRSETGIEIKQSEDMKIDGD